MISKKIKHKLLSKIKGRIPDLVEKQDKVEVTITGLEKWNFPRRVEGVFMQNPPCKKAGIYDVEGHAWTDVILHKKRELTNGSDLKSLWQDIKNVAKEIYSLWFEPSSKVVPWKIKHWKTNFLFTLRLIKTISIFESSWVWTVQSLSVLKDDIVDEMMVNSEETDKCSALAAVELGLNLTRKDILNYLNKHYIKINGFMWVLQSDPTCIAVDEYAVSYDLKDGYSNYEIISVLEIWFLELFSKNITVVERKEPLHDAEITRGILLGQCDIERGDIYSTEEVFFKWQNIKK